MRLAIRLLIPGAALIYLGIDHLMNAPAQAEPGLESPAWQAPAFIAAGSAAVAAGLWFLFRDLRRPKS